MKTLFFLGLCFWSAIRLAQADGNASGLRLQAEEALKKGDFFTAATFSSVLTQSENAASAEYSENGLVDRVRLAVSFRELGDMKQARSILAEALEHAPPTLRTTIQFEWLKTLYLEGTPASLEMAFKQYEEMPGSFTQKVGFQNSATALEAQYLGAMSALRTMRLDQARNLAETLPKNSDFSLFARGALASFYASQSNLANQANQEKSKQKAAEISKILISDSVAQSPEAKEAVDFLRLSLAQIWFSQGLAGQVPGILSPILPSSRYYQSALLGRAWALVRTKTPATQSQPYLEAIVYSKRAMELDSYNVFATQASLLSASCYRELKVFDKASEDLSQALQRLDHLKKIYQEMANPSLNRILLGSAFEQYTAKTKKSSSLKLKVFLDTEAAFDGLAKLERFHMLRSRSQAHLAELEKFISLLKKADFDPGLLRDWQVDDFQPLISQEIIDHSKVSSRVRQAHRAIEERLKKFELAKRYSEYLIEERKWQNLSELLVEQAIMQKMKNSEQLIAMDRAIREHYLSNEPAKKTDAIVHLEGRISSLDKSLFLEDRFVNQAELLMATITQNDKTLADLETLARRSPNRFTGRETLEMKRLRVDVNYWLKHLAKVEKVFRYYRESKRFRSTTELIHEYVANPDLKNMQVEIDKIRAFLEKVQKGDEGARLALLDTLTRMQHSLSLSYTTLNRHILQVVTTDLWTEKTAQLHQLDQLKEAMEDKIAKTVAKEVQEKGERLERERAMIQFELAKVLDQKSFKQ